MDISVCICTHNRPHYVRACLAGLAGQTVGPGGFTVLVVDSGSTGGTPRELSRLVAAHPHARLIRVDRPGVALARNAGAWACRTRYIAYIDDDAVPAPDWIASILAALAEATPRPAVLGGRVLPEWEAPLPSWWPPSLRGVLSIIEAEGQGEYGAPHLPPSLAPYTVNMVVDVLSLLAVGGFIETAGRVGETLLSDEDVQLAWRLRQAGQSIRYDSRVVVHHRIQAGRLNPGWLLARLYWQGASTVQTRRLLDRGAEVWRELPRRIAVALLGAPAMLLPRRSTRLIGLRWRVAYAAGFLRAALGGYGATTRAPARPAALAPPEAIAPRRPDATALVCRSSEAPQA